MTSTAVVVAVALVAVTSPARAEPHPPVPGPRVIHAPTAWVLGRHAMWGTMGATHRDGRTYVLTYGFAGLAEVEYGTIDEPACAPCPAEATFKLALPVHRLHPRLPAAALGMRRGAAAHPRDGDPGAAVYLVTSAALGRVRLHGGVTAWDRGVRPFGAVEWTPPMYPRTTLQADVTFQPVPDADDALRAIGGWGVRYQAFSWGAVELAVRHRQDEALGDATVLVRFNMFVRHSP